LYGERGVNFARSLFFLSCETGVRYWVWKY